MNANENTATSSTLERALALIRNGYSVIPVGRGDKNKAPLIDSWQEFMPLLKDGSSGRNPTEAEVRAWWQQYPNAKVAIPCGWKGLAVIDVDETNLANQLIEQFRNYAPLVRTPRGGLHIYLTEEESSKNGPLIKGVVDIKSAGGYVIAPPSEGYTKINSIDAPLSIPNAREYAAMILSGLGYEIENGDSVRTEQKITGTIPEGSRNTVLTSFAGSLKRNSNGISEEAILAALQAINQTQCKPPLSTDEVARISKSVFRYSPPADEWPGLVEFNEYNLPPFPLHALPPILAEWSHAEAEATQTPVDLSALLALATIAVACQRKFGLEIKPGYTEPLNIYLLIALDPGSRKSAVFRDVMKPIYEYEQRVALTLKDKITASQNEYLIVKRRVKLAQEEAAKASPEELAEKRNIANEFAVQLSNMRPLAAPRYVVDDATTEKLVSLLCEHDERIAMLSADSDIFLVMAGRYSAKGEPNFGIYLKAHIGDSHRVDRVHGPSASLEQPALTLALTVQLSVLQDLTKTPQFAGRGLLARFWYALPISRIGNRRVKTAPVSPFLKDQFEHVVTRLLDVPPDRDERHKTLTRYLQFAPDTLEVFEYYASTIEPKLSKYGELNDITSWASKVVGSVARLTGLLHLAEHHNDLEPWRTPIEPDTLYRAIEIGDYLTAHAQAAHGYMKADSHIESAKYVLDWILKLGNATISKRDLYRRVRGKLQKMSDLELPLNLLIQHGYVRERQQKSQGGRLPSPLIELHPDLLKKYGHNGQKSPTDDTSGHSGHQNEGNPHLLEDVQEVFGDTVTPESNQQGALLTLPGQARAYHP